MADWGPPALPREVITEQSVLGRARIAVRPGFPSAVNPDGLKRQFGNGRYPDLWSRRLFDQASVRTRLDGSGPAPGGQFSTGVGG